MKAGPVTQLPMGTTPRDETLQQPHVQSSHPPFSSPPPNVPPPPASGFLPPHVQQQGRPYPGPQFGSPSQPVMFPPGVPLQPPLLQRNASQPYSAYPFMHQARVNVNGPPLPGPPHQQQYPPPPLANSQNLSAFPSAQPQPPPLPYFDFPGKPILQSQMAENKVDVNDLLSQIRALVGQAEEAVQKVGKLAKLEPSMSEPHLVTCPYNPTHRVSPEGLFKHFLCCSSSPKPKVDAEKLISSLRYPHGQNPDEDSEPENGDGKTLEVQNLSLGEANGPNSSLLRVENMMVGKEAEKDNTKVHASILGSPTDGVSKASSSDEIDIWGGRFFYKDSPAVVQAPLPTPYPASEVPDTHLASTLPVDEWGAELDNVNAVESMSLMGGMVSLVKKEASGDSVVPLLSSRFWFLQREIEMWKEFPTRCSTLVLQAATGLGRIRRKVVSEWVLMQGPAHGVVIDAPMANHIHSLAKICLKALQREAFTVIDHQNDLVKHNDCPPKSEEISTLYPKTDDAGRSWTEGEEELQHYTSGLTKGKVEPISGTGDKGRSVKVSILDCPHLFQSGQWLASQLSSLFGPLQSKVFVLKLFKHCLVSSGRILASSFIDAFPKQATKGRWQRGRPIPKEVRDVKPVVDELQTRDDVSQNDLKPVKSKVETVDRPPLPLEVETAISAVHERAVLESYFKQLNYPSLSSKFQMIQEHEAAVMMAAAERPKRVNYRPVVEHDGLIWHRSQLEEKNKNKTKEERLAEERDYKRRRMSYRGKKLKRNPTEVLHDLIGGHMEEIVEAGGIGCFVKHAGAVPPSAEAGGVDNSRSTNDAIKPNQAEGAFPAASTSYPSNFDAKDNKGSWNDQSRGRPSWRDGRFNEQSRSRTFEQDVNHSSTGSRSDRYSEMDDRTSEYKDGGKDRSDGSQGKFHRHDSYHRSGSSTDNEGYHSSSGKDHGSDFKHHGGVDHSGKDRRRDRSRSQRYSESQEGSNEDDNYEKRRSREYRGMSKSSY